MECALRRGEGLPLRGSAFGAARDDSGGIKIYKFRLEAIGCTVYDKGKISPLPPKGAAYERTEFFEAQGRCRFRL